MNLSNQVAVLEQENERLSRLVDTLAEELEDLKQNPPVGEMEQGKDYLLDLLAPEIVWAEENLKSMGPTLEGLMRASVGDYVIRGVQGELYPCKPDIFEQTYDLVEE